MIYLISFYDFLRHFHHGLFIQKEMYAISIYRPITTYNINIFLAIEVITNYMMILRQQFLLEEQSLNRASRQSSLPLLLKVNYTAALLDVLQILLIADTLRL